MIQILPNWHPIFVHFTIALFSIATLLFFITYMMKDRPLKSQLLGVAYWNLWIGAGLTIATVFLGWLAYNSVAHDTASHIQMTTHRNWAFATSCLFLVLTVWSIFVKRANKLPSIIFVVLGLSSLGLLGTTAWHGGEAVYRYGLGVMSLPKSEGKQGHAHKHEDGKGHDINEAKNKDVQSSAHDNIESDSGHSHDSKNKQKVSPDTKSSHSHGEDSVHKH